MSEAVRVCRACELPEAPKSFEAIERSIIENNMLSEDRRAEQAVYIRRLEKCLACSRRMDATCMECGCFIQLRAMDRYKDCPHPAGSRW